MVDPRDLVDLRDALRPFVHEAATQPRQPVEVLAERARRRQVRRRTVVAGAGLAAAVVAVVALVGQADAPEPADQVSVVDTPAPDATAPEPDPGPSTTVPATTPTTARPPAPPTSAPVVPGDDTGGDAPLRSLVDGVVATSTTTSEWDRGYCVEILVENTTGAPVDWQVRYRPGGDIATRWNAMASEPDDDNDGAIVFTGEEFNRRLAGGESTTFGTCIDT
ncbi:MAG TPA: cellulose binding domain-containing protein [Acidimicrobiales bacterium]|nr:cellulose binding domain-containing protein [Acidimicrobiales bacterium]